MMIWYLQRNTETGHEFWDSYQHRDCEVLSAALGTRFRDPYELRESKGFSPLENAENWKPV